MKYIFFTILFAVFLGIILAPPRTSAIDLGAGLVSDAADTAGFGETTDQTFAQIAGTVVKAVLSLVGIIFTFLIAYAGNMWMTARGNQDEIDKAKKIITGSILGLVITLGAYAISNFAVNAVLDRATGPGLDIGGE